MGDIPGSGKENKFMEPKTTGTSDTGISLVKEHEGFRNAGYFATEDETKEGLVTVGYGSTGRVAHGEQVDDATADQFLREDLQTAEDAVRRLVTAPLEQNQFDALVSLVFNVGEGNFGKSKALEALNTGDLDKFKFEAFSESHGFTKQNGKVLGGLVKRRAAEQKLFEGVVA